MRRLIAPRAVRLTVCLAAALLLWGCQTSPKDVAGTPKGSESIAQFLRTAAVSSQRSHNYAAAVNYYQSLYARNPDDKEAVLGLARNLRFIGATSEARRVVERALEDAPEDPDYLAELGKSELAAGEPETALATLAKVEAARAGDWRTLSAEGIALDLLGRYAEAQAKYDAALAIARHNISVLNNLALSKALAGELDAGIAILERTARQFDANAQVRQNLALLYAMKGDMARAERLLRRDLPPRMVHKNLTYYRRVLAERASGEATVIGAGSFAARIADAQRGPETAPELPVQAMAPVEAEPLAAAPATEPSAEPTVAAAGPAVAVPEEPTPAASEAPEGAPASESVDSAPARGSAGDAPASETAVAAAMPEPAPGAAEDEARDVMVELGVYPTAETAREELASLRSALTDVLAGLAVEIAQPEEGAAVVGYRLLAGPLASEALAADLCTKLHSLELGCTITAR